MRKVHLPRIRVCSFHSRPSLHQDNNEKKLPSFRKMFVSVSRVKPFSGPKWNFQASLRCCIYDKDHFELSDLDFDKLQTLIEGDLAVEVREGVVSEDGKDWCLVWHMSDSGQLGRVYDDESFRSAVEDHRHTHKRIVQLYIIESNGEPQVSMWMQKLWNDNLNRRYQGIRGLITNNFRGKDYTARLPIAGRRRY